MLGGTQTINLNIPFTKLEFWTWDHQATDGDLKVNGVSISEAISNDPNKKDFSSGGFRFDATSLITSPLTNTTAAKIAAATSGGFTAVYVDGKMLVNPGARNLGDTRVEYQTNGGQGEIVSVNTTDNTLLIKDLGSNTRDNRWIKSGSENKAGTDFCVAGPTIIDSPLLTTNVELESSQFATTPDASMASRKSSGTSTTLTNQPAR